MPLTFSELSRERNRDQIAAEALVLTDVLHEALMGAFAPPQESEASGATDPEKVARMSLEQFSVAMKEAIPKWSAGETTLLPGTTLSRAKVAKKRIEKKLQKEGVELEPAETTSSEATPTRKGSTMPMTKPKFTTRDEVLKEATKLARQLMTKDPSLSLAAARAKVWEQNPDLAQAYKELPKGPEVKVAGAVRKGQSVIDKATQKAREIQKSNPGMSLAAARSQVWKTHPDLVAEYERASRS